MKNHIAVSLIAASLFGSSAAFAQSTTATGAANGARALHGRVDAGRDGEAGAGRQRIDDKILKSCMPSRHPELQNLEYTDHDDRCYRGEQPISRIRKTKCETDQHECERVLAILTEVGMRPGARRS